MDQPEHAVAETATEARLVVDDVVSGDLFHLVDTLATLEARAIVLPSSTHIAIRHINSQPTCHLLVVFGVVAFRLIAPPVGSTAEPQPKSN